MAQNKITQQIIADKLNISVPTVSKALNDHPDVNSETHTKVIDMATKLGYNSPERKTLTSEKHHLIGVFVSAASDQWQDVNYFAGMSSTYAKMNISLLFHYCSAEECELILSPEYQPPAMRDKLLSGAILVNQWPPDVVERLREKIPCVSIIDDFPESNIDVIGIDENEGISELMDHLNQLGHRKIGFFTTDGQNNQNLARFGAYTASIYRLGLEFEPGSVIGMTGEILDDKKAIWNLHIKQVVEQIRRGVRAWMCTSNHIGYELYRVLTNWGYEIPKDVSITGFGDGDKVSPGCPKMTGMNVPYLSVGAEAVRRLLNRLHHPTSPQLKVKLQCKFKKGQTTAPCPSDIKNVLSEKK
ncbi:MAG: LacI family DNA-binding transcriptional regulator [Planctomycetota bacterium]|jgi:DNA-binding LacI/PurR family transcriptional regulator